MTPPRTRIVTLSEDALEEMLERAARKGSEAGIRETFTSLGVDISTAEARIKIQQDFSHLRKTRTYSERVATFSLAALITSLLGGVITLLWAGYQVIMKGGAPPHGP
ncbi:MAG: hypothetical protein NVV72_00980 [Asticcacaulis sp.]|nr:hypothetical protein [Asticcacaulis sp.]